MKRFLVILLTLSMLMSLAVVSTSAKDVGVAASTWNEVELQAVILQNGGDVYSDVAEDLYEMWWEDDVPEVNTYCQTATTNARGFAMSHDGRYAYIGTLNGGTGIRGCVVLDMYTGAVTDLYYHYDGENGLDGSPFSWAKGIAADDRGYVYVGFAFSLNYNVVNLGIAAQQEDGTLEEQSFTSVYDFGVPGDEAGIHVGVNGVDVVKIGEKYYCYVVVNYDYDALYCFDVTDPEDPELNEDFGVDGVINFSDSSNQVVPAGYSIKECQYLDVDEDGTIWMVANFNEGTDGIMKIAPDGSACGDTIVKAGIYCVEHIDSYLLCGMKDGSAVQVIDDSSYEAVGTVELVPDYGDRITRIQVVNGILFVCDAGNDGGGYNAIQAGPVTDEGVAAYEALVASLNGSGEEDGEETTVEGGEDATKAPDDETKGEDESKGNDETQDAVTGDETQDAGNETDAPNTDDGCASAVFSGASLLILCAAAFVAKKRH